MTSARPQPPPRRRVGVNACKSVRRFHWEVGSKDAKLASGSATGPTRAVKYLPTLPLSVASALKWICDTYVAPMSRLCRTGARRAGLSSNDRRFLSKRAGYITVHGCDPTQTVDSCFALRSNGNCTPAADGAFLYAGGPMEKHANLIGRRPGTTRR